MTTENSETCTFGSIHIVKVKYYYCGSNVMLWNVAVNRRGLSVFKCVCNHIIFHVCPHITFRSDDCI